MDWGLSSDCARLPENLSHKLLNIYSVLLLILIREVIGIGKPGKSGNFPGRDATTHLSLHDVNRTMHSLSL